jgi:hypothetical protein
MSGRKMFPPRSDSGLLGNDYDEVKLRIGFRIQAGQLMATENTSRTNTRVADQVFTESPAYPI